jgi:hypothetical protein
MANPTEVIQMLRVNTRVWIDLQCVVIVRRVLEQAIGGLSLVTNRCNSMPYYSYVPIERIEHFVRE